MGDLTPRDGVPRLQAKFLGDTYGGWARWLIGLLLVAATGWLAMRDQVRELRAELEHHKVLGHETQQQEIDKARSDVRDLQEDIRAIRRSTEAIERQLGAVQTDVKELSQRRKP